MKKVSCIQDALARCCLAFFPALFLCLVLCSPSLATMYRYTLEPGLSVGLTYDDNIGLVRENPRSDWATSISPSIAMGMASQRTRLNMRYTPTYMRWRHGRDTFSHSIALGARHDFSKYLKLEFKNDYLKRIRDPFDEALPEVLLFERIYEHNRAEIKVDYQFGPRDFFSAGYRHNFVRYASNRTTSHGPFGQITYWFDSKHGMDAGYSFTRYDFRENQSGLRNDPINEHSIRLGYLHRFSTRTLGSVRYGLRINDSNNPGEDYLFHQGTVGLDHDFSETLRLKSHAGVFRQSGSVGNNQSGFLCRAELEKTLQRGIMTVYVERDLTVGYLEERRRGVYPYWMAGAGFNHRLTDELNFYSGLSYRRNDRVGAILDDRAYGGRAGLRLDFQRWYALDLEYRYRKRFSDDPTREYTSNLVMLTLSWRRPFQWTR